MTTQKAPARIALISVPVIIGVALLATSVPFALGTLWVLLVAMALLVTWWLVLNLLDGAAQSTPVLSPRIMALAIIGVALLAAGVSS